jgi:hypothetical protein
MRRHVTRIVFGAVNEARLSPAHEVEPENVETWHVNYAAVVAQPTFAIERGHVEPPVVGPKTGRPDDGAVRRW